MTDSTLETPSLRTQRRESLGARAVEVLRLLLEASDPVPTPKARLEEGAPELGRQPRSQPVPAMFD